VQAIVALFNEWTALAKEVTDLKKQIDKLTKDAAAEDSKKSDSKPKRT
jgi:cell division protein FtsB